MRQVLTSEEFHERLEKGERRFVNLEIQRLDAKRTLRGLTFQNSVLTEFHSAGREFHQCDFTRSVLNRAFLDGSRFHDCRFVGAAFSNSTLRGVDFQNCDATEAWFDGAVLESVSFVTASLVRTSFRQARLDGIRVDESIIRDVNFHGTSFHDCGLGPFIDDGFRTPDQPPTFDWRTICKLVRSVSLESFLLASGTPEIMAKYLVEAARAVDVNVLFALMRSTFISYGGPDKRLARKIRDRLQANDVRTFFFETDALPGERLHQVMRKGINEFDRVILICSKSSLKRAGVRNEIQECLAREARDGGATYLIPVTLDGFLLAWSDPLADVLRERVVADFRGTGKNVVRFRLAIANLLRALRTT